MGKWKIFFSDNMYECDPVVAEGPKPGGGGGTFRIFIYNAHKCILGSLCSNKHTTRLILPSTRSSTSIFQYSNLNCSFKASIAIFGAGQNF